MTVQVPKEAFEALPEIVWSHVDGPMMVWAGRCHWLTMTERLMLLVGWTDPETIAFQRFHRRPRLSPEDAARRVG